VFLGARSDHDLKRSTLVRVFLRILEYYQRAMFLTVNRIKSFYGAFHSRIYISLRYKELDSAARKKAWRIFGEQMETGLTEEDYDCLATYEVNGRRAKNIWGAA
jgi:hypothetical protein